MDFDDDRDDNQANALTGFLFGNIDEEGKLEDDVLDEESKRHLGRLNDLGIGSMVREITEDAGAKSDNDSDQVQGILGKAENAVDYSDITEVADDNDEEKYKDVMQGMVPKSESSDDYDDGEKDKALMPPPSWIPTSQSQTGSQPCDNKPKLNTPLAALLPPEFADKDVRDWFPEFRPGQVLRFSRLFKSSYKPQIWKKKKKPKSADDEQKSPTKGEQKSPNKISAQSTAEDGTEIKKETETDAPLTIKEEPQDEDYDGEDGYEYCPYGINLGREARPEECMLDDAVKMMQLESEIKKEKSSDLNSDKDNKPPVADWRYGPAQLWYDMLGVDESGQGFDYGLNMKAEKQEAENVEDVEESELPPYEEPISYPEDAFTMVAQTHWEDDVIFNADDVRSTIMSNMKKAGAAAGWIPSPSCRTLAQYIQQTSDKPQQIAMVQPAMKYPAPGGSLPSAVSQPELGDRKPDQWFSIFPVENEDLLYSRWEDDIIWDARNVDRIPSPRMLTLDLNDDNIILKMPDDKDPDDADNNKPQTVKEKKQEKRSRIVLGKAGIIKDDDMDDEEEEEEENPIRDPFNLSNDEYYNPKLATDTALRTNSGATLIQHSIPAVELRQPYFPTHMSILKLRQFHRNPLKRYSYGSLSAVGPHSVHPLLKNIKRKQKAREQERLASGGGDMFFMRTAEDLTGKDGDLVLAEYSEEFPPLLMQIGMATKIKNYFKRKPGKDSNPPEMKYGELAYAHSSPFLGAMTPGQCLPAFENNMFRAPIYQHRFPVTDFLVIRTRQQFCIREIEDIFTVGQECPLYEVPGPNSKKANNFLRDYLQVYIYRKFWGSKDNPRRLKMEEIKKAFPLHSESSIRKRLKLCADFKRTGTDSNWWVLKPDFRLPTEDEMRAMVSPEQCCSFYSMLAAEQRLKDAGYGEKSLFAVEENDDDENNQVKIDDEVRAAPWNTTHSYIQAMKGKCLLSLTGVADPTGCGEGFSYVKVPNKPSQAKKEAQKDDEKLNTPPKKTVTGTDADLRRLPLKDAKAMLRNFGVAEADIKKLSRWEVIDVVRTMSTEQAKAGSDEKGLMSKFARGNRFSVAEHQERYKEECQRIFDLQNKILASSEVLSTDDEDTEEEDSDFEEMSKNIDQMLLNKKTSSQVNFEREEQERKELQKMLEEGVKKEDKKKESVKHNIPNGVRKLKITRKFRNEEGREYTRTEIVRKSAVIDIYMKIRQTKDASFIRQFAALDETQKEEMKKERRRLQEQLRRIKRNQEKDKHSSPKMSKKKLKELAKQESSSRLKCGACGQSGHMRTNKECPLYAETEIEQNYQKRGRKPIHKPSVQVAITEEQEAEISKDVGLDDVELVKVEGTKMKLSKELLAHADKVKKKALTLKIPKAMAENKRRRRAGTIVHCDYLRKPSRVAHRRRADPMVTLSTIFENIINEMRDYPGHDTTPFQHPVNPKHVPDYYRIVQNPISLQVIRERVKEKRYETRESFIRDVSLLVRNSEQYNGAKSVLTDTAKKMLDLCLQRIAEKEERLMKCEKAINPLLDDNDAVAFAYILNMIMDTKLKKVEHSHVFMKPVNRKVVKDYYDIIEQPMELETIKKKIDAHKYSSRAEFLSDVELIKRNSTKYNGESSPYTKTASLIYEAAVEGIKEHDEMLAQYEVNIQATQQAALEAADSESVLTGNSLGESQDGREVQKPAKRGRKVGSLGRGSGGPKRLGKTPGRKPRGGKRKSGRGRPKSAQFINTSFEDQFVDIEGDEEVSQITQRAMDSQGETSASGAPVTPDFGLESTHMTSDYEASQYGVTEDTVGEDDSLAQDLQMSDNDDIPKTPGASDSDDMDGAGEEVQALLGYGDSSTQPQLQYDQSQSQFMDYPSDIAMDTDNDATNQGDATGTFDPDKFFESWQRSLGGRDGEQGGGDMGNGSHHQQGAAADLQLSESDSDQDFEEVR